MGKSSINGPFSMAMLNNQMVHDVMCLCSDSAVFQMKRRGVSKSSDQATLSQSYKAPKKKGLAGGFNRTEKYEFVNWDDVSQYMGKKMFQTTNQRSY